MKRKIICLYLVFFIHVLFSNVSSSYPYRDIKSPIISDPYINKIVVYSPARTGSTLVYMILQYLFETKLGRWYSSSRRVLKEHELRHCMQRLRRWPQSHIVVTIRNPLDSYISYLLTLEDVSIEKAITLSKQTAKCYNEIHSFIQGNHINKLLVLRYEDFENNLDKLLTDIENDFNISVPIEEKIKIKTFFSKKEILNKIKIYKNFKQYDSCTGLHGNHIAKYTPTLEELFPPEVCQEILSNLSNVCRKFNYPQKYIHSKSDSPIGD